jgi:hypothetical protein
MVDIWNDTNATAYRTQNARDDLNAVLEQWKTLVETAERVSTRRAAANAYFLALNTLVLTGIGIFWKDRPQGLPTLALLIPLVGVLATIAVWWGLLVSYRALNVAKFEVIHLLEARLPARVFQAEWDMLSRKTRRHRFRQLTSLEQSIPLVFAGVYLVAFAMAVATAGS